MDRVTIKTYGGDTAVGTLGLVTRLSSQSNVHVVFAPLVRDAEAVSSSTCETSTHSSRQAASILLMLKSRAELKVALNRLSIYPLSKSDCNNCSSALTHPSVDCNTLLMQHEPALTKFCYRNPSKNGVSYQRI